MIPFLWALIRWFFSLFVVTPIMLVVVGLGWLFYQQNAALDLWQKVWDKIWYDIP